MSRSRKARIPLGDLFPFARSAAYKGADSFNILVPNVEIGWQAQNLGTDFVGNAQQRLEPGIV